MTRPKIPSFDYKQSLHFRDQLLNGDELQPLLGHKLDRQYFEAFVTYVWQRLPQGLSRRLIYDCLSHLVGTKLDAQVAEDACWRLAGNLPKLRRGDPVLPWSGLSGSLSEWAPLRVIDARAFAYRPEKPGAMLKFRVLAGRACPLQVERFCTRSYLRLIASRVGFTRANGTYPFRNSKQFFNMRMFGLIEPSLSSEPPNFSEFAVSASFRDWNRYLLKQRKRADAAGCPRGYSPNHTCEQCHVGLGDCPWGTHPQTYEPGTCVLCEHERWHEPGSAECVSCQERRDLKRLAGYHGSRGKG